MHRSRNSLRRSVRPGFALIITLSMMVLLALLAVGLLSLSSISLRSAGSTQAQSLARANARLALMLALGDLQKYAGPDQCVTARADIRDESISNPKLTGVWRSWKMDANDAPVASDYSRGGKDEEFLCWLASCVDGEANKDPDFAARPVADPVILWGEGTLGVGVRDEDLVRAEMLPISTPPGACAWAVLDEGLKARINTEYTDKASSDAQRIAQLGSGTRANTSSIEGLGELKREMFLSGSTSLGTIEKGLTWQNMELAADRLVPGIGENLKGLYHDVTTTSIGLFSNVAEGGLKEDFNLLVDGAMPAEYEGSGIYESLLGTTAPSDPYWESLQEFAALYNSGTLTDEKSMPVLKATVPRSWLAAKGSNPTTGNPGRIATTPPEGVVLMPEIAKVQIVFSLLTRDIYSYPRTPDTAGKPLGSPENSLHFPWGDNFKGSSYDYLLHLLYTPVVTLHNPYNVALEFSEFKVLFGNVPFALKIFRNGEAQTRDFAPLDTMYYSQSETGSLNKRFGMTLRTNGGNRVRPRPGTTTFRMLPGEVIMFSPYIDPNRTWAAEYSQRTFSDWDTGSGATRTLDIDAIPGWRGDGIGFDLDWFCPTFAGRTSGQEVEGSKRMNRDGCIGAKRDDEFHVEFAPLSVPKLSRNKYTIELFGQPVGQRRQASVAVIEMDYEKPTGLQELVMGSDEDSIRFPREGTINALEMHSHSLTPISDIATVKPFAVVSTQSKTTFGGMNPDGEDGKLATKPWAFAHATVAATSQRMLSEHHANHSHEFDFQRLDNGTVNLMQFDPETGRGNAITGLTGNMGRKFGVLYEIPLAPVQNFAQLNGANPGGASGFLPRFAQPIGNSWAHPLLPLDRIRTDGDQAEMLDHSFLLNLALYDRFYFSGIADQTGAFGSGGLTAEALAESFQDGTPLADPRLFLSPPNGQVRDDFSSVVSAEDGYRKVAAWQQLKGPFNINSTSVQAWKAMLASIHDEQAMYNSINRGAQSSSLQQLPATDESQLETRISRFRLPAEMSSEDGADPLEAYWLGPREYSDAELELLAEEIVEQVRERGPFRSMSEFVNRQVGTGDSALRGALQQAIDNSGLNEAASSEAEAGYEITENQVANYKYAAPEAGTGLSSQGAPGYLSQADILNVLGNAASPRSDTFTIRAYGEARDASNRVIASATCEATVQRSVDFLDSLDDPETRQADLQSATNRNFGRDFQIVSFRWLAQGEI